MNGWCGVLSPDGRLSCVKAAGHALSEYPKVRQCANPSKDVVWCGFCLAWSCELHQVGTTIEAETL